MSRHLTYLLAVILYFGIPVPADAQNKQGADAVLNALISKLQAQKEDTAKVKLLNEISYRYHTVSPYDGIKYGNQALALATELHWKFGMARANSSLGANYYALSRFPDAYNYWQKALKIHEEIGFEPGIANHLHNIGNIFFSQQEYGKAQEYYLAALKIYDRSGDKNAITNSFTSLGNVCAALKDYGQALEYQTKALNIDKALHFENGIAADLMNIGSVYTDQGAYCNALAKLFEALAIRKNTGDKNGLAQTYGLIGKTFLRIAAGTPQSKTKGCEIISGTSDNLLLAISYLDSAIRIDKEISSLEDLQRNNRNLSEAQEYAGNYKEALADYKNYGLLKDSIYSIANGSKIFNIERKEELDAKNNEIAKNGAEHKYFLGGILLLIIIIILLIAVVRTVTKNYTTQRESNQAITAEKKKSEDLLLNILPAEVANELREKGNAEARYFENVTVLFTDFVGFTKASERLSPKQLVAELDACFSAIDVIVSKYSIEKIKTVGDAYLAVCGLPLTEPYHAQRVVNAAMEISQFMCERKKQLGEMTFEIRIGIHSGEVIAGIVGLKKFAYDIWGDTVNIAARMEQNSEAGKINISQTTYDLVKDKISCVYRGEIDAKNKGKLIMYYVAQTI